MNDFLEELNLFLLFLKRNNRSNYLIGHANTEKNFLNPNISFFNDKHQTLRINQKKADYFTTRVHEGLNFFFLKLCQNINI